MCQIDVCTCTRLFETMPGVQPPSPTTPFSGRPTTPGAAARLVLFLPRLLPSLPCHTNPYRYLPTRILFADRPAHRPSHLRRAVPVTLIALSISPPSPSPAPLLPPATHTTITTHLLSRISILLSLRRRLFPFLFPLPSSSNARSNPPGGYRIRYRKYGNTSSAISQRECDNTKNFD